MTQLTLPGIRATNSSPAGEVHDKLEQSESPQGVCLFRTPASRWPAPQSRRLTVMGFCMCMSCYNGLLTQARSIPDGTKKRRTRP